MNTVWWVTLTFTAASMLAPATLGAQDTLTVERAVQESREHNASLRAGRAGVAEGATRIVEARSGGFPRLSVSEAWQRGNQPVFVFSSLLSARQFAADNFAIDTLNHPDATGFFRLTVGAEHVLFDGGRQKAAVDRARLRHEMSQLSLDEATAGVVMATTEAYGRILAAEAARAAADASLQATREDWAKAGQRRDAGMATDADVLALVAQAADLQQRVIQYEGDAAIARAELNRLMGAPIDREYRVTESVTLDAPPADRSLTALLAEADNARPELRRAGAAERLAQADGRAVRSGLIPQIVTQAAVDISGTRVSDRAAAWIVGGEARWNLSLGGAQLARVKAATEARLRAAAEVDAARAAAHVDVVTAFHRRQSASARQAAGRAAVEQARESQRIVRNRFEAGLATVTDVLRASSALVDAETQRVSAIVDAMVSDAMLNRALGRRP